MNRVRIAAFAIAALAASPLSAAEAPAWSAWGDDLFARATAEKRFVILDLEAVWCHWCHVMEKTTYADPEVAGTAGRETICRFASIRTPIPICRAATATGAGRQPSCSARRHRDRQDQGLYRAGADAGAAQGHRRRSLAGAIGRRGLRSQAGATSALLTKAQRAELTKKLRRILGRRARRLGREPEIHRRRQHGSGDHPRRGRRRHGRSSAPGRRWTPRSH